MQESSSNFKSAYVQQFSNYARIKLKFLEGMTPTGKSKWVVTESTLPKSLQVEVPVGDPIDVEDPG